MSPTGSPNAVSAPGLAPRRSSVGRRVLLLGLLLLLLAGCGFAVYRFYFQTGGALADSPQHTDPGGQLANTDEFEQLAKTDPVAMFDQCLTRYQREAKGGFRARLFKRERVDGKLHPEKDGEFEEIRIAARGEFPETGEKPHVRMIWDKNPRSVFFSEVRGALFVEGENNNELIAWRPKAVISTKAVPVNDADAKESSRYCIRDAGLYRGMLRTYEAWKARQETGNFHFEYLGKRPIPELDGRVCYVVKRVCPKPEVDAFELGGQPSTDPKVINRDGFTEVEVYIDAERWVQAGTVLRRTDVTPPRLVGQYFFHDIELNPSFDASTFTVAGMKADGIKK